MHEVTGSVLHYDMETRRLILELEEDITRTLEQQESSQVALRIIDGREISQKQRGKIFGITRDIARHFGYFYSFEWEEVRGALMEEFSVKEGITPFSLSDCEKSVARDLISYRIDFCMRWDVPTSKPLRRYSDDFGKYLYLCLEHRQCAQCRRSAQVHHVKAIGMGRNRDEVIHEGMPCIALCAECHTKAHASGWETFSKQYHLEGIELDRYLCGKLGLRYR